MGKVLVCWCAPAACHAQELSLTDFLDRLPDLGHCLSIERNDPSRTKADQTRDSVVQESRKISGLFERRQCQPADSPIRG
jgi:hypothetical protein